MAIEREGKFLTYDVSTDTMKVLTADDVSRLEEQGEALGMCRNLTVRIAEVAQQVVRRELSIGSFREFFHSMDSHPILRGKPR